MVHEVHMCLATRLRKASLIKGKPFFCGLLGCLQSCSGLYSAKIV